MNEEEENKRAESMLGITKEEFMVMCKDTSTEQIKNITMDLIKLLARFVKTAEESKKAVSEVAAANFKIMEFTDILGEVEELLKRHKDAGNATIPIENIKNMLSVSIVAERTFLAVHGSN